VVPPLFVALTIKFVAANVAVGVPVITPVALMAKPTDASVVPAGEETIVQLVGTPLEYEGVSVTALPIEYTLVVLYVNVVGARLHCIVNVLLTPAPLALYTVTTKFEGPKATVGVPVIFPVVLSKLKPAGNVPVVK